MRVSLLLWLVGVFLMSHAKAQELPRPIFICPTEEQSILCNTEIAGIYYTNCTGVVISQSCYQCIVPCEVEFETVDINCASSDCVYGLCSSYLSYLYSNNTFNFTCRDLYTDQYCTYCETCLVSSPGNESGGGNISTEICDNIYSYIFCRLLPEDQTECYPRYGVGACQQCSTLLEPFGCTRIDGQPTALQNETLCDAQSLICPSLPAAVNCTENQQIDCQYCSYLTTNEICDTQPTNPVLSCDDSLGLFCSLVNRGEGCFQKYNASTCEFCTIYTDCPAVQPDTLTLAQTNTLCNSEFGTLCPFLIPLGAGSNCYPVGMAVPCDFCTETLPICEYDNSTGSGDNSTQPDTCNSEYSLKCTYDIIYFPCIILYGNTYCSECSSVVESCDVDFGSGFLPPNLCSNENFVSLCYLATQLDDCASELSPMSCEFCSSFVNTMCPTPSDPNAGLSILCSTRNALVCQFLLDSEGECADPEHENDCGTCRGRDTLCAGFSGSGDGCDSQTSLFCRLFVDESDCIYSDITCDICNDTIDICGPLEFSNLTVPDIATLCRDFDTTCPSLLSNCDNFQFGCDQCTATQSICTSGSGESGGGGGSAGSGASDACTSSLGAFLCRIVFVDETECLSQYSAEFCTNCSIVVDFCGALTYSDLTSDDVNFICDSIVFCPPFLTDPSLCRPEDQVSCNYTCNAFEDLCTSGSGLLPICISDEGNNCGIYYSYFPCYTGGNTYGCDICAATIQSCPNLAFQPDYVPPEVCASDVYVASCNTIISDPLCYTVYGNELCQYCKLVNSECPTLSSDEIISALDSGCDDDYQYCQEIIQSNRDECRQRYTAVDCGYCTLLNVYCQNVDNSSGSGSGSGGDCSDDISFFCNYATADSLCESNFFPSTCRYCQNYLAECSSGSGGGSGNIGDFCYSDFNLAVCGNFPLGPACRFLLPEHATTCDYCNFYADSCSYAICSDSDLINACTDLYYNGEVPTLSIYYEVSSETEQCIPCSLFSRVCPKLNETAGSGSSVVFSSLIFPSPSPSEFVFSSSEIFFSSEIFSSSFIFSPSPQFTSTEVPDSTSTIATITTTSASATFVTTSTSAFVTTSETVSTSSVTTSESVSTSFVITSEFVSTSSVITSVPVSTSVVTTTSTISPTTTTRSTVSTTSDSTTRSTTTRSTVTSPTPTRTSLPPEDQVDLDDLSDEERQNVVGMTFEGLTRTEFLNNVDQFIETLEALIDAVINSRKRQSDDISIVVVTESLREVDGNLEIVFVARQRDGGVVNGNTVVAIVDANKQDIASSVGAEGIGEVSQGLPDYLEEGPSDSSGLSGGAVAGIVIVILLVVIVVLAVAGVAAWYYATHSRRGKYIIGTTGNDNEVRYVENPAALAGDSRDKLALSQSMPMQETDDTVTVSVVVKNENTRDEVNETEAQTKEMESSPDVVDSTQGATGGEEKEEEKKKDDHSSSNDSSDDEEDKKEKPKESIEVEEDEMNTDL